MGPRDRFAGPRPDRPRTFDRPPGRYGDPRGPREPQPAWRERPWRPEGPPTAGGTAPPDLLAADEELIAGRRPVEEAFVARRPARRLLVVPQRRQALERVVLHATSLRIPVVEVEGGTLTAIAGFDGHQGVALVVEPRTWASLDEILARAVQRGEPPFVLILDSLEDPQNVGTLLRSAEAAGIHGVVFPTHHQAPLTPAAVKASAGAVEHLLLCPVDDLPAAMSDLRLRGLRIAAAEAEAPLTAAEADLRGPLALVVGSEGQGLSPAVRRRADLGIRIPMRGAIGSLNASVAGSILLFAAVAQRDPGGSAAGRGTATATPPTDAAASGDPAEAAPESGDAAEAAAPPQPPEVAQVEAPAEPPAATKPRRAPRSRKATTHAAEPEDVAPPQGDSAANPPAGDDPPADAEAVAATPAHPRPTPPRKRAAKAAPPTDTEAVDPPAAAATAASEPPADDDQAVATEGDDLLPGGPPTRAVRRRRA